MYQKINFAVFKFLEKSKFTQLEVTKGSIASLVSTQHCDFLEKSLSCGTFGLFSLVCGYYLHITFYDQKDSRGGRGRESRAGAPWL